MLELLGQIPLLGTYLLNPLAHTVGFVVDVVKFIVVGP